MADPIFFNNYGPFSLEEIARIADCEIYSHPSKTSNKQEPILIEGVAPLESATSSDLTFLSNPKYLKVLAKSKAGACILERKYIAMAPSDMAILISDNSYKSYALAATAFYPSTSFIEYLAPSAKIDKTAIIGTNCYVDEMAIIGPNVIIGDNCRIGASTVIERGVIIGSNCNIGPLVSISHTIAGSNILIHPGVRIGQDGFGFATDRGRHIKVPQLGRVIIGDNVEIGANTCIDRGSGHDTVIGDNCMIDNLVQIGHNAQLGKGCIIVAQVGIAGSSKIGDYTVLGGQVGVAGHLTVGSQVQVAAQSGITYDIADKMVVGGTPAVPIKDWHRQTIILKKLVKNKKGTNDEQ
jgi:UDP-3-O-[3-hydroxymyristoyl] glucosamine N-acyltransferase